MTEMQIIHNYAAEREVITLKYVLKVMEIYKEDTSKVIEAIEEKLKELNAELAQNSLEKGDCSA